MLLLEEKRNVEMKAKNTLGKLEKDFYKKVADEIKHLENERRILLNREDLDGVAQMTHKINRAKRFLAELITERVRKILKSTIWSKKLSNMTPEEEAFYEQIKASVDLFKNTLMEGGKEEEVEEIEEEKKEEEKYVLVRVIVPTFKLALPNRDLVLHKEDVLHLPEKFFRVLAGKGIVQEIKLEGTE